MARGSKRDGKREALLQDGVLNRQADKVIDPLFLEGDFFDPRDMVQVKYEMLRRADVDGLSVSAAASAFGLSRVSFYETRRAFGREGLVGFLPKKRGPRGAHKLTEEVMDFIAGLLKQAPSLSAAALSERLKKRFGLVVHARSIERALRRPEKKRR